MGGGRGGEEIVEEAKRDGLAQQTLLAPSRLSPFLSPRSCCSNCPSPLFLSSRGRHWAESSIDYARGARHHDLERKLSSPPHASEK